MLERELHTDPSSHQEPADAELFELTREQVGRADELAWSFDEVSVERCTGERVRLCGYNYGGAGDRTLAHEEYVGPDGRRSDT